jgi:glucose/arabinose dehydrogenase
MFPAWKGNVFIGGLNTTNLVRLEMNGERVIGEERLIKGMQATPQSKPDRIRDVRQGPDGAIYVVTDMAQGRVLKLVAKR